MKPVKVKSFECNWNHETGFFSFTVVFKPFRQKPIAIVGKKIPAELIQWQAIKID